MSDFIAKVRAELDTSTFNAQMTKLTGQNYTLKLNNVDATNLSKKLTQDLGKAGKTAGQDFTKNFSNAINQNTKINASFKNLNNTIQTTTKNASGLGSAFGTISKYFSSYQLINKGIQELKEGFQFINQLDDAITNISYTMDVSEKQLQSFSQQAVQMAKDLKTSATSVLEATTLYANANESIESILKKSETSIMLSNVTGMSATNTSKMLQAIMNQFDLTQDDLLEISDTIQTISQSMAYDFADGIQQISDGISASGSLAENAGLSLAEYSAMLGTVIEQTGQGGSTVGNAMKTIISRTTKASEVAGTLAEDISAAEESLRGVGVEVRSSDGEFRELDDTLGDLAAKWGTLTEVQKSNITFELAGTRQSNVLDTLLKSWDAYEDRVEAVANLDVSPTLQNQEKYAESMTGHLEAMTAAAESFWNTFIDSQSAKDAVDFLTDLISAAEKLVDVFGSMGSIGLGVGIFALLKNRSYFTSLISSLADSTKSFENFGAAASMAGADLKAFIKTPMGVATAIGAVTAVIGVAVQAYQKYQAELRQTREAELEKAQASIESAESFEEAYIKISQYADKASLTADEETELKSAIEQVNTVLGDNAGAFDTANGSAQEYLDTISQVTKEQLNQAKIDATKERAAAEKLLQGSSYDWWSGSQVTIDLSGRTAVDEFMKAKDILNEVMSEYVDMGTYGEELEPLNWDADNSNMDAVVDYYYELVNLQNKLAEGGLTNNDIYDDATKIINDLEEDVNSYVKAKYDELKYTYEAEKGIPDTVEEYEAMCESIESNVDASDEFKKAMREMAHEDFADSIDFTEAAESTAEATEQIANNANNATSAIEQMTEKTKNLVSEIGSVQDILNNQTTGKSISLDDFNSEELVDYKDALEYVNGSMQLNVEKVNEIVKAKAEEQIAVNDTNKAYAQQQYLENASQIEKLRKKIKDANYEQGESEDVLRDSIAAYQSENDTLLSTINNYELMSASLEEATSAYQHWINAQSAAQSGDMFDSSIEAMQKISDTLVNTDSDSYGRIGNQDYKAAVDFVVPESVDHEDTDAVNKYMESIKDLFTYDSDGKRDGLDIATFCEKAVDAGLMVLDDPGENYQIAGQKTMEDFAEGLNLSLPLVQAMFGEMEEFGAEFDWSDEAIKTIGDLGVAANESAEKLRSIDQFSNLAIALDVSSFETSEEKISALDATIAEMNGVKAKVDVDSSEVEDANTVIKYCVAQKQLLSQPDVMTVDTSMVEGKIGEAISLLQEFQSAQDNLEMTKTLGMDTTQAQADLDAVTQKIQGLDTNVTTALSLDTTSVDTIKTSIGALSCEMIVKAGVDESAVIGFQQTAHDAKGTVEWDNNTRAVDAYAASQKYAEGQVKWYNNTSLVKTKFYATGTINWSGSSRNYLNGTAHLSGTANASGDWGTAVGGTSLVGELGQEIVVDPHTGRWYTVGDKGAEFRKIPKGAIVFNHKQTESLLANGFVAGRATALASGTAMVTGGIKLSQAQKSTGGYKPPSNSSSSTKSTTSTKSTKSTTKAADDFEESFDFVEIALNRIHEAIDRIKIKAESVFKTFTKRNNALADEVAYINAEIELQQQAYNRYMQEANSVGLSSSWAAKVRDGSIDISTITDENLADQIKEYQEYYEKAIECKDAVAELHEEVASLYQEKFDNVATQWEGEIALLEHLTNSYNNGMDLLEAKGYVNSMKYYEALEQAEKQKQAALKKELTNLTKAYNEAMNSGEIAEGSQAWNEMQQSINSVKEELQESNIELAEFAQEMRELDWSYFDLLQERISSITEESEFLIDLLADSDLFDDKGNITDAGMTTMGLHAQNHNTYMNQADQYGAEAAALEAEIEADQYNQDLIERREELLELQRESILAAEQEEQAIVDLVEDGINIQLDAMKELIDKYTDSLESAKSLYEYQKKVEQQTANIANIQKQLSAYQGDTSEENRARIQKLQVDLSEAMEDLEETQYDQYITDQKKLLDGLYQEYSTILNERLDNVDALLTDVFNAVNENSATISTTLSTESANVGYTISENMKDIWSNEGGAYAIVTKYGDDFSGKLTSVNEAVNAIAIKIGAMVDESDKEAEKVVEETKTTTPTTTTPKKETTTTKTETTKTTTTKSIKVGGKINAGSAKIYESYDDKSGARQYFRNDPIYTVLKEKNGMVQVRHHSLSKGITGWFKKSDVKAYATGLRKAYNEEEAWVNELGSESLIRPTDSAIITHVAKGDSILDAEATKNIWDMANDPSAFIGAHSFNIPGGVEGAANGNVFNSHLDSVNFNLPNVHEYKEFYNELVQDPRFEKAIQAMTLGRTVGESALKKYQYLRK